jgi:hypothetical protein
VAGQMQVMTHRRLGMLDASEELRLLLLHHLLLVHETLELAHLGRLGSLGLRGMAVSGNPSPTLCSPIHCRACSHRHPLDAPLPIYELWGMVCLTSRRESPPYTVLYWSTASPSRPTAQKAAKTAPTATARPLATIFLNRSKSLLFGPASLK